ncbi:huntingtin-interacting protein 1-like isoform X2 [Paramacrobiotus metropolitanus]|uniref:huntingtin-interacting protein 1-like isoform X2 n=1 Tax=Paramacrobiotus metropolitanus TaxID=2943436 RepID=UPI0024458173|nr:huntingtin-interacting protein 1-like isoform X2 [Paramacrobiotus metropolitanus]
MATAVKKAEMTALQKAVNPEEVPAKEKHIRTLIIGTFQEKGAHTFWTFINSRIPVQGNPVVAWKFCYVLHRILRDAHPSSLKEAYVHRQFVGDVGRLWGHLKLGYGPLITKYCELLTVKLDFHNKNPRFPGNLQISNDELGRVAENDVNNYFQLSVEMFDYMEQILDLANVMFGQFDMSRANSMTNAGQCRLIVLIPCIMDSCQLYDFIVKMMFRLHSSLPQDVLSGHRERFNKQFKLLQQLYYSSSNLQFFKNLLQIPSLPEKPPNFFSASAINQHVTPVAKVQETKEAEGDQSGGFLVDTASSVVSFDDRDNDFRTEPLAMVTTTKTNGHHNHNGFGDNFGVPQAEIVERDRMIDELLQRIESLEKATDRIKSDDLIVIDDLRNRIVELERDFEELRAQHETEKAQLLLQIEESTRNPQVMANYAEMDRRSKVADEKFKKMRDIYNELREKHLVLLRANGETEKQCKNLKKNLEDTEKQKNELNIQVMNFNMEKEQLTKSLNSTSSDAQREISEKTSAVQNLERRLADLDAELSSLRDSRESLHRENQAALQRYTELQEQLKLSEADLEDLNFQHNLQKKALRQSLLNVISASAVEEIQHAVHTWEQPAFTTLTATPEFLLVCIDPAIEHIQQLKKAVEKDDERMLELAKELQLTFHFLSHCLIQCMATSHMAPIDLTDEFSALAKEISEHSVDYLDRFRDSPQDADPILATLEQNLEVLQQLSTVLIPKVEDIKVDEVADMVEKELHDMDKAIEEAALKIEEMLVNSRSQDSGIKLQVNAKILDSCTTLMAAIRVLVRKSRTLQQEIVAAGKGFSSPKEFYKKNHRWTEGLLSAAKTVGLGANVLLEAADKVVSGKGKFEELVVASQEISAGTVQLVVSSKVKADKNSQTLAELSMASKSVTQATATVVASAKDCAQLIEEKSDLDFSALSIHKIKKIEMESQVRVLELETELTREREKLSAIRRQHYSMAGQEGQVS